MRDFYQKRLDEEALRNSRLKEMHDLLTGLKTEREAYSTRMLICPYTEEEIALFELKRHQKEARV